MNYFATFDNETINITNICSEFIPKLLDSRYNNKFIIKDNNTFIDVKKQTFEHMMNLKQMMANKNIQISNSLNYCMISYQKNELKIWRNNILHKEADLLMIELINQLKILENKMKIEDIISHTKNNIVELINDLYKLDNKLEINQTTKIFDYILKMRSENNIYVIIFYLFYFFLYLNGIDFEIINSKFMLNNFNEIYDSMSENEMIFFMKILSRSGYDKILLNDNEYILDKFIVKDSKHILLKYINKNKAIIEKICLLYDQNSFVLNSIVCNNDIKMESIKLISTNISLNLATINEEYEIISIQNGIPFCYKVCMVINKPVNDDEMIIKIMTNKDKMIKSLETNSNNIDTSIKQSEFDDYLVNYCISVSGSNSDSDSEPSNIYY